MKKKTTRYTFNNYNCTYRDMKIKVYSHYWTGPQVWYYETKIQDGGNFTSRAKALKAARAAIDKHLLKKEKEAECAASSGET